MKTLLYLQQQGNFTVYWFQLCTISIFMTYQEWGICYICIPRFTLATIWYFNVKILQFLHKMKADIFCFRNVKGKGFLSLDNVLWFNGNIIDCVWNLDSHGTDDMWVSSAYHNVVRTNNHKPTHSGSACPCWVSYGLTVAVLLWSLHAGICLHLCYGGFPAMDPLGVVSLRRLKRRRLEDTHLIYSKSRLCTLWPYS